MGLVRSGDEVLHAPLYTSIQSLRMFEFLYWFCGYFFVLIRCTMLVVVGQAVSTLKPQQLYQNVLETPLLDATRQYYAVCAQESLDSRPMAAYCAWVWSVFVGCCIFV